MTDLEIPYPLDSETAAAIEAANRHYVMPWEVLDQGDELISLVTDSFLANGKTPLPDEAYGMVKTAIRRYSKDSPESEVKELFESEENFQRFIDGEDYSVGFAVQIPVQSILVVL